MNDHAPRLLTQVPDHLLTHGRGRQLEAWCLDHGFRPSLLHIEAERANRANRTTPTPTRLKESA